MTAPRKNGSRAPAVVAIGGFDPSCGAGVVADARTLDAMGALPLAVVTALTVQSGSGVRSWSAVPPARVRAQLDELLANLPVAAAKIGQVPTAAAANAVARSLAGSGLPVVLDPVLVASGGGRLVDDDALDAIVRRLLPLASLVTVNLDEASVLVGRRVATLAAMRRAAADIQALGAAAVLVKGGHLRGDPVDLLRSGDRVVERRARRLAGSMHGTGCALASAIAARLAAGDAVGEAARRGQAHVRQLLRRALPLGKARLRPPAGTASA